MRPDGLIDLIADTAYHVKLIGEKELSGTPLSLLSNRILATIAAEPGVTIAELSRRIPKTQQMISHVVAQLSDQGLVERRLGTGRGVGLHVSDAGRDLAERGLAHTRATEAHLGELLNEQRSAALMELLGEFRSALRDDDADADADADRRR